ncbi:hypothetical protein FB451DRAFT_1301848 [Mycena latifolia]|nr:hypothetical protein FB451DRAFT_1301848 [Mycena latifolia]
MPCAVKSTTAYKPTGHASERAADRARLEELEAQIRRLEKSLRSLKTEKDLVQRRLAAYSYPVLTLPTEIMAEIFIRFLPTYPNRPATVSGPSSPILLCHICRDWREIALSTPGLWRAFNLTLTTPRALERKLHFLDMSLKRSGSYPLSIQLDCSVMNKQASSPPLLPYLRALSSHRTRWEHLKLHAPLESLRSIEGPLPALRSIQLSSLYHLEKCEGGPALTAAFLTARLLRKVALQSYSEIYSDLLPWSQLTVLTVDRIILDHCQAVLNLAPNLVHCRFGIRLGQPDEESSLSDVTSLPHLKSMALLSPPSAHSDTAVWPFLELLTIPALEVLHVTEELLEPDPIATLVSLTSRSGCTPQMICIGDPVLPIDLYRTVFPSVAFRFGRKLALDRFGRFPGDSDIEDYPDGMGESRRFWQEWEGEEADGIVNGERRDGSEE